MTSDAAESLVEDQALRFEELKGYLLKVWAEKPRV
jgi:hypothetical protein